MASKRSGIGASAIVGILAVAIGIGVFGLSALRAETAQDQNTPPLPVSAYTVEYENSALIDESYPGLISARRESALGFPQGGLIDSVAVDVGDRVESGGPIARLDTRALVAQLAAADAQSAEAGAQTALARDTQARQASLFERGHISQQRLDEAATSTAAAEARQNAARASADALRVQLDLAEITAPFDGVVTSRLLDEGSVAAPGQPVVELVEFGALEIRVGLVPAIADQFNPGELYDFISGERRFQARFRAATGVVDRQTRTVTAVFDLEEGSEALAGEVARLIVQTPIDETGFWIPSAALSEARRGLWSVFVLQPDNGAFTLEPRLVETVRVQADRAFVRGAVADGDFILATGLHRVTPGQRVRITTPEEAE